eukprot:scaffold2143_cov125-Cylindrotheca_fusiformis.AAC.5
MDRHPQFGGADKGQHQTIRDRAVTLESPTTTTAAADWNVAYNSHNKNQSGGSCLCRAKTSGDVTGYFPDCDKAMKLTTTTNGKLVDNNNNNNNTECIRIVEDISIPCNVNVPRVAKLPDVATAFKKAEARNFNCEDWEGIKSLVVPGSHANKEERKEPQQQQQEKKGESTLINDDTSYNKDKAPLLKLIRAAGVRLDPVKDQEQIDQLPMWREVTALYGDKPIVHGLDSCERFRMHSDPADHFVGVAGTFNTGTNLMASLLILNCHIPERTEKYGAKDHGMRFQVPWGKHTPPGDEEYRQSHKCRLEKQVDADKVLPVVTIRDPLVWLRSMCRNNYAARWLHGQGHCPNFSSTISKPRLQASVRYANWTKTHDSILYLWNDWYNEYYNAHFPHLFVRYEDLVFHPKEVTQQVCECAGGKLRDDGNFNYLVESAKKGAGAHGSHLTGFVDAIVKYGSQKRRYDSYKSKEDLEYIRDHVDPKLMEIMHYPPVDPDFIQQSP